MLDLLKKEGAPTSQAESVAEAVIRHQDLGETGSVTSITAIILLATIFGEFVLHTLNFSVWCSREQVGLWSRLSAGGVGGGGGGSFPSAGGAEKQRLTPTQHR